jgi:transposase
MLKVPQQQYIKFLREHEGCSIIEIAERMNVNWRTAKKYADKDDWNEPVGKRVGYFPVLGPFLEIIDTWLLEDEALPRKQRHTARRIFHRLQTEHGFTGGERTVQEYVAKWRKTFAHERAKSYERLEHPGGEAQVDFGTVHVTQNGKLVERKILTASFPFSNVAFAFPVPSENTECFLEALKRLFEQIGGVPRRIWFDNLSAAVASIEKNGERKQTEAFARFCAHYRFEPVFCNVASGNEKGNVENKVGYGRRNWCVPIPVIQSLDELVAHLEKEALEDRQRVHYVKKEKMDDLWCQERTLLYSLPIEPLEVFRLDTGRLNKYCELSFENVKYPLPQCKSEQSVLLKVKWDRIEVLDESYDKIYEFPRPYTDRTIEIEWKAVLDGLKRRPRSVMYSTFVSMMPEPLKRFLRAVELEECKTRLSLVRRLLENYTMDEIAAGLDELMPWDDHVETELEHALYKNRHPEFHPEPFHEQHTPVEIQGYHTGDLASYNELVGVTL